MQRMESPWRRGGSLVIVAVLGLAVAACGDTGDDDEEKGDLAAPAAHDLSSPADLAAPLDLARLPDLTRLPDLSQPPDLRPTCPDYGGEQLVAHVGDFC